MWGSIGEWERRSSICEYDHDIGGDGGRGNDVDGGDGDDDGVNDGYAGVSCLTCAHSMRTAHRRPCGEQAAG